MQTPSSHPQAFVTPKVFPFIHLFLITHKLIHGLYNIVPYKWEALITVQTTFEIALCYVNSLGHLFKVLCSIQLTFEGILVFILLNSILSELIILGMQSLIK